VSVFASKGRSRSLSNSVASVRSAMFEGCQPQASYKTCNKIDANMLDERRGIGGEDESEMDHTDFMYRHASGETWSGNHSKVIHGGPQLLWPDPWIMSMLFAIW
jgi:hypothetical protein